MLKICLLCQYLLLVLNKCFQMFSNVLKFVFRKKKYFYNIELGNHFIVNIKLLKNLNNLISRKDIKILYILYIFEVCDINSKNNSYYINE